MAYKGSMSYGTDSMDDGLPSHIYYNAQIINNRGDDFDETGLAYPNPPIRFTETRDASIIKDCSKYNYSIVRFTMNGANLALPVWIPNIQIGQSDYNLTNYGVAITYQQTWNVVIAGVLTAVEFECSPLSTYVSFVPENTNTKLAPLPNPPLVFQDSNTSYYWISSYNSAVDMFNTAFSNAMKSVYALLQTTWLSPFAINGKPVGTITTPFPYTGYDTGPLPFWNVINPPTLSYDPGNGLFSFNLDSDAFGPRIATFVPGSVAGAAVTPPICRLFMNNNSYGLFSNIRVKYYNTTVIPNLVRPVPEGYVYEIITKNNGNTNIRDQTSTAYQGAGAGQGFVPPGAGNGNLGYNGSVGPTNQSKRVYVMTQDFASTDSLWSPIGSIVFCTTLMPVRYEATGTPIILGTSNLGASAPTSQSAFQPIVTDIALDTTQGGAGAYRQFIYYAPQAEYRMSDLAQSNIDIRSIDIQVFWKNRLNNQLYPLQMFNLSSVEFKMMFRHKRVKEGK